MRWVCGATRETDSSGEKALGKTLLQFGAKEGTCKNPWNTTSADLSTCLIRHKFHATVGKGGVFRQETQEAQYMVGKDQVPLTWIHYRFLNPQIYRLCQRCFPRATPSAPRSIEHCYWGSLISLNIAKFGKNEHELGDIQAF